MNKIEQAFNYIDQLEEAKQFLPDVEEENTPKQLIDNNKMYLEDMGKAKDHIATSMYRSVKHKLAPKLKDEEYDLFANILSTGVAMKESTNRNIAQNGGGPGRGYYQYELPSGKGSGASVTASNRLFNITGYKIDEEDFTKLSKEKQTLLFLADKAETSGTTAQVMKIKESKDIDTALENLSDFWAKFHKVKFKDETERKQQKAAFKKYLPKETVEALKLFIK